MDDTAPRTRRRFGSKPSEKGYILAMAALLLIPMLAFTGFATDVGAWYARASRMQRAADAAALAGVVWQPNFATASDVARITAERNGFVDGENGIEINYYNAGARELRVEIIDVEVEVYFTSMFFDEIDITRDATAEYLQSLPMGSPDNRMGNDPIDNSANLPNLWLNLGARNATKVSGDRYTSAQCTNGAGGLATGCDGSGTDQSNEYDVDGHFFSVNVDAVTAAQDLRIQVYDPAYTYQGDRCENNLMTPGQLSSLASTYGISDAVARYGPGDPDGNGGTPPATPTGTQYCPGNQNIQGHMDATSYIVRAPDDTPFENSDNPVIGGCVKTFEGRNINANGIYNRLRESNGFDDPNNQGLERIPFREHFRQWYTVCTIPAADVEVGRYVVQVRSNPDTSNLPTSALDADTSANPGGHNRFSMRAGFGASGTPPTGAVGVYGEGRLPIYTNATADATTSFFVARVTPEYAGQVIVLNFFDIGDVGGGGSVNFDITPPEDSNVGANFSGCTVTRDGPPFSVPSSGCGVTGMTNGNYNGREVAVQIPIPPTYDCDETVRIGCWLKIELTYSPGANPNDTTTWSAAVLGDPVRLVE